MVYEGAPLKGKFVLKGGFNLGLSAKGWSWIAQKVGRPVLQRFLTTGGRALAGVAQYLAAEGVLAAGVVVAGTVIGTAAVTTLVAWLAEDARRKGELRGLATWYVQAYTNKVMGEARPSGFITGDVKLRDQLIALGEKDAVSDARRVAGMQGTDGEAIEIYRNSLLAENNDRYENVKIQLRRTLEEKSQRLAGL
jgi:hypothetical protein